MIKVRGDRVLVKMPKTEAMTDSGLHIPLKAQEPPMEGIVLNVGEGQLVQDVKVGDRVVFEQWSGLEVVDEDWGKVLVLEFVDLMMVANMGEEKERGVGHPSTCRCCHPQGVNGAEA